MIDLRTVTLDDLTPESIRSDPEIQAMNKALEPEVRDVASAIVKAVIWPAIDEQPEDVLDALAWHFRILQLEGWLYASLDEKRSLIKDIFELYARAGTVWSVKRIFDIVGEAATISEWFEYGGSAYRFQAFLSVSESGITSGKIRAIKDMMDVYKPVRAVLEQLLLKCQSEGVSYMAGGSNIALTVKLGDF
jgi:phage tail P2-like protein